MSIRLVTVFFAGVVLAAAVLLCSPPQTFSSDPLVSDGEHVLPGQPREIDDASTTFESHPAAHIEFAVTHHDFGNVTAGAGPSTEFFFRNTGDAPLIIKEVKGG